MAVEFGELQSMVIAAGTAKSKADKEKAYKNLEKAGMDRMTANCILEELRKDGLVDGR